MRFYDEGHDRGSGRAGAAPGGARAGRREPAGVGGPAGGLSALPVGVRGGDLRHVPARHGPRAQRRARERPGADGLILVGSGADAGAQSDGGAPEGHARRRRRGVRSGGAPGGLVPRRGVGGGVGVDR